MPFFREFILPYFARVAAACHKMGLPVMMHNDGKIWKLLDDLVASGINAYHPVERAAGMDLGIVKEKYRGKLCLVGNVNNKTTLATGSLEEVECETIECLRAGAPGGGYILAADHSLHDGQQVQNILKMIETAKKYGAYPLNLPGE
jgi:uroporphyrinogen decarboxylase